MKLSCSLKIVCISRMSMHDSGEWVLEVLQQGSINCNVLVKNRCLMICFRAVVLSAIGDIFIA